MGDDVETVISRFLEQKEPGVLAIKGAWGIGKTFLWNKALEKYRKEQERNCQKSKISRRFWCLHKAWQWVCDKIPCLPDKGRSPKYSKDAYVSLFGLNSLSDVKKEIAYELHMRQSFKFAKGIKLPSVQGISIDLSHMGWLLIRDNIVCIDDFERRGKNLCLKDVFGLVSVLKEQKNCKIVLIINDDELDTNSRKIYDEHREKIIDIETTVLRDRISIAEIVFEKEDECYIEIVKCVEKLKIENIRTLLKIKNFREKLNSLLKEEEFSFKYDGHFADLKTSILRSLVLLTYLAFSRKSNEGEEEYPSPDDMLDVDWKRLGKITASVKFIEHSEQEKTKTDEYKRNKCIERLYENYGWYGSDALDRAIGNLIKNSYLDRHEFKSACQERLNSLSSTSDKNKNGELREKAIQHIWNLGCDDPEEIYKSLLEYLSHSVDVIGPSLETLRQYTVILKEMGEDAKADAIIHHYIDITKEKDLEHLNLDSRESRLMERFDKKSSELIYHAYEELKEKRTKEFINSIDKTTFLKQLLEKGSSFEKEELDALSSFEESDFYKFLKSSTSDRSLHDFLKSLLNTPDQSAERVKIRETLQSVIKRISEESDINKWRLRDYLREEKAP